MMTGTIACMLPLSPGGRGGGALTVRGEAVLALAVAGTYLLPLALLAAAPLGRAVGRLPGRRRPAWGAEVP